MGLLWITMHTWHAWIIIFLWSGLPRLSTQLWKSSYHTLKHLKLWMLMFWILLTLLVGFVVIQNKKNSVHYLTLWCSYSWLIITFSVIILVYIKLIQPSIKWRYRRWYNIAIIATFIPWLIAFKSTFLLGFRFK